MPGPDQSPNSITVIAKPKFVYNSTCEQRGYDATVAFISDPFYGVANNVSLFVTTPLEWIPIAYLFMASPASMSSLAMGWGNGWKLKHPKCK